MAQSGVVAWIDLVARVECRSEAAAEQRPVAVWIGGEREPIFEVLEDAMHGAATAGQPAWRRLLVELAGGRRLELRRRLPDGAWQVRRLQP